MKERNIDYNIIIGTILTTLIIVLYFYFNPIEKKPPHQTQETKTLVKQDVNQEGQEGQEDKERIITPVDKIIKGNTLLENDLLQIKISNKGGEIEEVILKKYQSHNPKDASYKKSLSLVRDKSLFFNIRFLTQENNKIDTQSLYFNPQLIKQGNRQLLELRTELPKGGWLVYHYSLEENSYKLDFSIHSEKIKDKLAGNSFDMMLKQKVFSFEKQKSWEDNYTQMYFSYNHNKKVKYLSESSKDEEQVESLNWIANKQQFFTSIFHLESPLEKAYISSHSINEKNELKEFSLSAKLNPIKGEMDLKGAWHFSPLKYDLLKKQDNRFEEIIPFGWGILKWINKYFFLIIFQFLEKTHLSYGIIIILMTLVVKLALSPITYRQYKLSAMMKIIRPEVQEINKKHEKSDPLKKQQAIMDLYRKTGVNPMGGCLPAFLQIPIFYALFKFFPTIINLRGESFLWADDLTSYDSIYNLPFSIPFYGDHISLFTLLYALALLLYSKVSGSSNMSVSTQEGIPNMQFMVYLVPVLMLLFINSYASGLSLYYFVSNTVNIALIFIIKKYMVDEGKIREKIQENKLKEKKPKRWQKRFQDMIKEAQKRQQLNNKS